MKVKLTAYSKHIYEYFLHTLSVKDSFRHYVS